MRIAAFLGAVLGASIVHAHHSTVGIYDSNRTVEVTGVVSEVSWRNPHGRIFIDVEDESGAITEWEAETAAISVMRNRGARTGRHRCRRRDHDRRRAVA